MPVPKQPCKICMKQCNTDCLFCQVNTDFLQCEDFLVADTRVENARHFIFSTQNQLRLLKQANRWYMDGTFKVMYEPFNNGQLMSIHAFIQKDDCKKQVPLAFVMMSQRRKADYVAVLTKLKEVLVEPAVEVFVVDFETGAWVAVREVFPGIAIKGCVFHWTQAVWRNVQDCGLKPTYSQRAAVHGYIRQLLALPFLPARHIPPTFNELKGQANTEPLKKLVVYIDKQWMRNRVFDVRSWSVFGCSIRTNNDVEGWHYRLNHRAGHIGLTFYRLVPLLRKEAELVELQSRLVTDNLLTRETRTRYTKLEEGIQKLWSRYSDDEITTAQVLRGCARQYAPSDVDDNQAAITDD